MIWKSHRFCIISLFILFFNRRGIMLKTLPPSLDTLSCPALCWWASGSLRQVHTQLLTSKWHELLVLTTCSYQAIRGIRPAPSITSDGTQTEFQQEVSPSTCCSGNACRKDGAGGSALAPLLFPVMFALKRWVKRRGRWTTQNGWYSSQFQTLLWAQNGEVLKLWNKMEFRQGDTSPVWS